MMTDRRRFDPVAYAEAGRKDRFSPLTQEDLARFGEHGYWRAGTQQLLKVILGWWVAEDQLFVDMLDIARQWLDAPEERGRPWGENSRSHEARHRHARALAHLLFGDHRADLWAAAAEAHAAALDGASPVTLAELAPSALLCGAMAGADAGLPADIDLSDEIAAAVVEIVDAADDAAAVGRLLRSARAALFARPPELDLTTLFAFVFMRLAGLESIVTALRAGYVIDPDLALPPALESAGWADRGQAMLALGSEQFERLARLLPFLGLSRDPDALPQGDRPAFASWTRQPDFALEADWHAPPGTPPHLEIRGRGAGRLAAFLGEAVGGTPRPGPEAALTELLTVPQRAVPASASAAEARWEMLCVAVAGEGVFDDLPGRALVSAGLADSDWRVRLAALWAVGHHRIGGLAAKAEAAALPKPGDKGLSQDDRRVLLALRDLAAARSAGRPDPVKPGANAGFVAQVAALIDRVPEIPDNRAGALVMALLRKPLPRGGPAVPSAWKLWMAPPHP